MPLFALRSNSTDGSSGTQEVVVVVVAKQGTCRTKLVSLGPFTCVDCGECLFVRGGKVGGKVRLHFSHHRRACNASGAAGAGGGGESAIHRAAKASIHENGHRLTIATMRCSQCRGSSTYDFSGMPSELEGVVEGLPEYRFDVLFRYTAPGQSWLAVEVVHTCPVKADKIRAVSALAGTAGARAPRIFQLDASTILNSVSALAGPSDKLELDDTFCSTTCDDCATAAALLDTGKRQCKERAEGGAGGSFEESDDFLRPMEDYRQVVGEHERLTARALAFESPGKIMRVRAVAGGGKSTFVERFARQCDARGDTCLILMFNREPVDEMSRALGDCKGVCVKTMHGLFWDAQREMNISPHNFPGIRGHSVCIDKGHKKPSCKCPGMVFQCMKKFLASSDPEPTSKHCRDVLKKQYPKNAARHTTEMVRQLKLVWGRICSGDVGGGISAGTSVEIDIKLCQVGRKDPPLSGYRYIMVDECQDLSDCELDLLLRRRDGVACVAIGDEAQNINQFRGASDTGMFEKIDVDEDIVLPSTWRFTYPLSAFVEKICKLRYPDMRIWSASSASSEGMTRIVQVAGLGDCLRLLGPAAADLHCICRTNAALLENLMECIDLNCMKDRRVVAKGLQKKFGDSLEVLRDLYDFSKGAKHKEGLCHMLKKMIPNYVSTFEKYCEHCRQYDKKDESLACTMVQNHKDDQFKGLLAKIVLAMGRESGVGGVITMHTAHASKGKTLGEVYVGNDFRAPSGDNLEINTLYVALTRARRVCYIHDSIYELVE
jgi:hypothetical protein